MQVERDFLEINGDVRSNQNPGSGGRLNSGGLRSSLLSIGHDGNEYKLLAGGNINKVRNDQELDSNLVDKIWTTTQSQPSIKSPIKLLYP